jgi:hypothetical protein
MNTQETRMNRPHEIDADIWDDAKILFHVWLRERDGVVVYENQNLSSSQCGAKSFMPGRYVAVDEKTYDAPARIGDVPSRFQERVDHIKREDFGDDVEKAFAACFTKRTK